MIEHNYLREKLSNKRPVIGTWSVLSSFFAADALSSLGLDFIVFDREHSAISFETIATCLPPCERRKVSPLVRVSHLSADEVQRALDLGAHGLHIPNIETLDQAKQAIEFSKYPPIGQRGFSPFTRKACYGAIRGQEALDSANASTLLILHLEGANSFSKLDLFLSLQEIDVIFVGLYDLSKSLGMAGNVDHPQVLSFLHEAVEASHRRGKAVGSIAMNQTQLSRLIELKIDFITYGVDAAMLRNAYTGEVVAKLASQVKKR